MTKKNNVYSKFVMNFFGGREDEGKRRRENGQTGLFFFKTTFLEIY